MENYNPLFLQQLSPFLVVQFENLNDEVSKTLINNLNQYNILDKKWDNSIIKNRLSNSKYIIKTIGSTDDEILGFLSEQSNENEHSILSPFNIRSDLFPNGILSEKWFDKYINRLPFALISIYNLPNDSEDDSKLIERINKLKLLYHESSIKFVTIIISSPENPNDDEDRINKLRQMTNLPKLTGLLYLHNSHNTINRDSEILVTSLLSNLKNSAIDFYTNIEYRIKQRHKKYYSCPSAKIINTAIEISPKFLETRNLIKQAMINQFMSPHNLETCLKILEFAYQNLIELLRENFSKLNDSLSDHDLNLYKQFRNLIDILSFHIVRGYLSIEEPVTALRKHRTHIVNVLNIFSSNKSTNNDGWISIQYEWLGELMNFVPSSILTSIASKVTKKVSKTNRIIEFFGGFHFNEEYDFDIFTYPGFVFLKSVQYLDKVKRIPNSKSSYLNGCKDLYDLSKHKIGLLENAKKSFISNDNSRSSTSDEGKFDSFIQYINWLMAEEYFRFPEEDSLSKSIEYFENSISNLSIEKWSNLSQLILQKLLQCYQSIKDYNKSLCIVLKLSTLESFYPMVCPQFNIFDQTGPIELNASEIIPFFKIEALLTNENVHNEIYLYDSCITQLVLKPAISLKVLKTFLPKDSSINLVIDKIKIFYKKLDHQSKESGSTAFKDVVLTHDGQIEDTILQAEIKLEEHEYLLKGSLNLSMTDLVSKVVQFSQTVHKIGKYFVQSIELESVIDITSKDKAVSFHKQEKIIFDPIEKDAHHKLFYTTESSNEAKSMNDLHIIPIRLNNKLSHMIQILPLNPDVTVIMKSNEINSVILGEKLSIPFSIDFKNPKTQRISYQSILLSSNVNVVCNDEESDHAGDLTAQNNWDTLKDDEPLNLKDLFNENGYLTSHTLNICIHSPSFHSYESAIENNRVIIDLKAIASEENEEAEEGILTVYDTATYTLPIINYPFKCKLVIHPRYRNKNVIDMPSPFILSLSTNTSNSEKQSNTSIPTSTRSWMGSLTLVDNFKLFEDNSSELEILDTEFSVRSKNSEVLVELVASPEQGPNKVINQVFTTRSKNGFSHRNVTIVASASIKWKRPESIVNEFKTEEWEITLPLSDPRVLLTVNKGDDNTVKLKYILENPTPRIFTFSTHLINEVEGDESTWNFDDDRNVVPLKQSAFPVLPFTRHVMEFYGKFIDNQDLIKLPQLKVFDVQYRVGLPTLSVTENVTVKENDLFWNKKYSHDLSV